MYFSFAWGGGGLSGMNYQTIGPGRSVVIEIISKHFLCKRSVENYLYHDSLFVFQKNF